MNDERDFRGYGVNIHSISKENGGGYVAYISQFPSCFVVEETINEALSELRGVFNDWLAVQKKRGIEISPPQ